MKAAVAKELRDRIRHEIAGYTPVRDIPSYVLETMEDEADGITKKDVTSLTKELLEKHRRAQEKWPEVTDHDRLRAAFADLEKQGVVTRENYTCCGNCGAAEMWEDEIPALKKKRKDLRGFVFFHQQDTDHAIEGHGLYFDYSGLDRTDEGTVAVGKLLVKALKDHGLKKVKWNGSPDRRVQVALDWKKRR